MALSHSCFGQEQQDVAFPLAVTAGNLKIAIAGDGKITGLTQQPSGVNYIHPSQASYLLSILEYGHVKAVNPSGLRIITRQDDRARVELAYDGGATVTLSRKHISENTSPEAQCRMRSAP